MELTPSGEERTRLTAELSWSFMPQQPCRQRGSLARAALASMELRMSVRECIVGAVVLGAWASRLEGNERW